jgi:hypothetical protein
MKTTSLRRNKWNFLQQDAPEINGQNEEELQSYL